jgi:hypothetical protein
VQDSERDPTQKIEVRYAGEAGMFLVAGGDGIALWDLENGIKIKTICQDGGFYRITVCGGDLFLVNKKELWIYRRFLEA